MSLQALLPHRCEVIGVKGDYIGCKGYVLHGSSDDDDSSSSTDLQHSIDKESSGTNAKMSLVSRPTLTNEHINIVKRATTQKRTVTVEFLCPDSEEPQFGHAIVRAVKDEYYSSRDICKV